MIGTDQGKDAVRTADTRAIMTLHRDSNMDGKKRLTLAELKKNLKGPKKYSRSDIGKVGENWAEAWLKNNGYEVYAVDAKPDDLPAPMKKKNAKRVDFLAEKDDKIYLLDAKHCKTEDCTSFVMEEEEIEKYKNGAVYMSGWSGDGDTLLETWFLIFPSECKGTRLVWVSLIDIENGSPATKNGNLARKVDLTLCRQWYEV